MSLLNAKSLDMTEPVIKRAKTSNADENDGVFNSRENIVEDFPLHFQKNPKYGSHDLDHFYTEELSEKITSRRFRIGVYRKQLRLRNIEDAPNTPDALLERLISHLIDEFRTDKHKQFGQKPESFSFVFRSTLLHPAIHVFFKR